MKIKVKLFNRNCKFEFIKKGEWIDLRSSETVTFNSPYAERARKDDDRKVIFEYKLIPLGIGMQLPEGYEAVVVPRSSTFKNFKIITKERKLEFEEPCFENEYLKTEYNILIDKYKEIRRILKDKYNVDKKTLEYLEPMSRLLDIRMSMTIKEFFLEYVLPEMIMPLLLL
jgi:hypothetical protein